MPQACRVCTHPQRKAIDAELSLPESRPLREMGEEYGLSKDSILRHFQNHLPHDEGPEPRQENLIKPDVSSHAREDIAEPRQGCENSQHEKTPAPLPAQQSGLLIEALIAENPQGRRLPTLEPPAPPLDELGRRID
jgi:hypothetical protein